MMSSDLELMQQQIEEKDEKPWMLRPIDVIAPIFFLGYVGVGSFIYMRVENWSSWSSIYFSVITLSTVGYGDLTPKTGWMRIFTLFYVYGGLIFYATVIGSIVGRRKPQPEDKNNFYSGKDESSWPEVPIKGGPLVPAKTPLLMSLYRQNIKQRQITIVEVALVIFLLSSIATIFYASNEEFSAVNALFLAMVTMSTVGYDDINTTKTSTMIFDVFFILTGVPLMVYIILLLGALFSKKMERRMFKNFSRSGVSMEVIRELADSKTGKVQRPDFLAYLLVHLGKVRATDINKVNALFDDIDTGDTGEVGINDLRTFMKDKNLLHF